MAQSVGGVLLVSKMLLFLTFKIIKNISKLALQHGTYWICVFCVNLFVVFFGELRFLFDRK